MNKICITFAGVPGCGKSPVATYLSCKFGFSIINTDNIRSEIKENLGYLDEKLLKEIAYNRLEETLVTGKLLIIDASVDREWSQVKMLLEKYDYTYYIISFDVSDKLLKQLYTSKGYVAFMKEMNKYLDDHKKFRELYKNDVSIVITDDNYKNRLEYSYDKLKLIFKS